MSEILVTPIFVHMGIISASVSLIDLALVDPPEHPEVSCFFLLLRQNPDGNELDNKPLM